MSAGSVERDAVAVELRPYQRTAVEALELAWAGGRRPTGEGAIDRAAVVMPTGTGKTVVFSELIRRAHQAGTRPLVLVHRDELANQAREKIHSVVPYASIGVEKADQHAGESDIVIGSVQTLANARRRESLRNIGRLIVDECHRAAAPTWRTVLAHFGAWDGTPTAGFTATMSREDDKNLADIWQEVVFSMSIQEAISGGYLVSPIARRIQVEDLVLSEVKQSRGDFAVGDSADALRDAGAGDVIARAYAEQAGDRLGVLFAPTVKSAHWFAEDLIDAGIATEVVTGDTPVDERQDIYERFRLGATQVLSTCTVLTEGWDAPWASCAVIARPTKSRTLYRQMAGRVLRPWPRPVGRFPAQSTALLLDVVGATQDHRLDSLDTLSPGRRRNAEPVDAEAAGLVVPTATGEMPESRIRLGDGRLVATDAELFETSQSVWLATTKGVPFIGVRKGLFFLWPRDGLFDVGWQPHRYIKAERLEAGLTLEWAMRWAERHAVDAETASGETTNVSAKSSSWRRGNRPPSQAQIDLATSLGIDSSGTTKSQLSDAINVRFADKYLHRIR